MAKEQPIILSRLPKTHPDYALIGRVASNWTHFEFMLDAIIWDLAGLPQDLAICLTGHIMGATPRFKIIESLGMRAGLSKDDLKPLRQLKTKQYEVVEERNRIVHDPWLLVDLGAGETPTISQLKTTGFTPVNETDVNKLIRQIYQLAKDATRLRKTLRRTLHDKRP